MDEYKVIVGRNIDTKDLYDSRVDLDFSNLPQQFVALKTSIQQWGIGDDILRDRVIEATSQNDLEKFVAEVVPFYTDLVFWLASEEGKWIFKTNVNLYVAMTCLTQAYESAQFKLSVK
jgi:hypothetical protein